MSVEGFKNWVGASKAVLVLVLTDVVNSTALAKALGNDLYGEVHRVHSDRVRFIIAKYNGKEIRTLGDSFMVAFRNVGDAVRFALELNTNTGHQQIRIRAAIHVGTVYVEEEDARGIMVNYTARIESHARGPHIWLSHQAKKFIDEEKPRDLRLLTWIEHSNCDLKEFGNNETLWSVTLYDVNP